MHFTFYLKHYDKNKKPEKNITDKALVGRLRVITKAILLENN